MRIEGFRKLGDNPLETVINKSEAVKAKKKTEKPVDKKEISKEEKEYKSLRKQIQEKLIKFATRIPDPCGVVTGLSIDDFKLPVSLNVFNASQMNQAVLALRCYEDGSLSHTGLDSHNDLRRMGLIDTGIVIEGQEEKRLLRPGSCCCLTQTLLKELGEGLGVALGF
jgi:hypothetical protein